MVYHTLTARALAVWICYIKLFGILARPMHTRVRTSAVSKLMSDSSLNTIQCQNGIIDVRNVKAGVLKSDMSVTLIQSGIAKWWELLQVV